MSEKEFRDWLGTGSTDAQFEDGAIQAWAFQQLKIDALNQRIVALNARVAILAEGWAAHRHPLPSDVEIDRRIHDLNIEEERSGLWVNQRIAELEALLRREWWLNHGCSVVSLYGLKIDDALTTLHLTIVAGQTSAGNDGILIHCEVRIPVDGKRGLVMRLCQCEFFAAELLAFHPDIAASLGLATKETERSVPGDPEQFGGSDFEEPSPRNSFREDDRQPKEDRDA